MILKINGDIVSNDWKEIYDWFELSVPHRVMSRKHLQELPKG